MMNPLLSRTGLLMLFVVFGIASASAGTSPLVFVGQYPYEGPFAGQRVRVECAVDLKGDRLKQQTPCKLWLFTPPLRGNPAGFRAQDPRATLQVLSSENIVRIEVGVNPWSGVAGDDSKHALLSLLLIFEQPVVLHDGETVVIGGLSEPSQAFLSLANYSIHAWPRGVMSNSDCLIFDILGGDPPND